MSHRDLLQQILSASERLLTALPMPKSHVPVLSPILDIPPLRLNNFTSQFQSEMLKNNLLLEIRRVAYAKANELAASYQSCFERTCRRIMAHPRTATETTEILRKMRTTFESLYSKRDLPRFLQDAIQAQSRHFNQSHLLDYADRPLFKHRWTPLLEEYFAWNAYPPSRDRFALARKTLMTPRQIEVWFQNHRARAKKDSKPLHRRSGSPPVDLSPEPSLDSETWFASLVENTESGEESNSPSQIDGHSSVLYSSQSSESDFSSTAPSHAFPTKYPPACSADPFPLDNSIFKSTRSFWKRTATTPPTAKPSHLISLDELIESFRSKLTIRDPSCRIGKSSRSSLRKPWFAATQVVAPSAPHPALIRSLVPKLTGDRCQCLGVATSSRGMVADKFQFPSTTLLPNYHQTREPATKNLPSSPFPSYDVGISSPSRGPSSRTSSFSSIASSSANLQTPPLSPNLSLPQVPSEDLFSLEEVFGPSLLSGSFVQQQHSDDFSLKCSTFLYGIDNVSTFALNCIPAQS